MHRLLRRVDLDTGRHKKRWFGSFACTGGALQCVYRILGSFGIVVTSHHWSLACDRDNSELLSLLVRALNVTIHIYIIRSFMSSTTTGSSTVYDIHILADIRPE